MSTKKANPRSDTTTCFVVEAKDFILIRKKSRRVVHRRKPKQTLIPAPPKGGTGCHLAAIVYDFEEDQTTFMYECDHKFANGSNSYTKTLPGKLDGFV